MHVLFTPNLFHSPSPRHLESYQPPDQPPDQSDILTNQFLIIIVTGSNHTHYAISTP